MSKFKLNIDPEYTRNLKTPKNGWKDADEPHSLASLCEIVGRHMCIQGHAIWLWAKTQKIDSKQLLKLVTTAEQHPTLFVEAVLENIPFEVKP